VKRAPKRIEFGPDDLDGTVSDLWVEMRRASVDTAQALAGGNEDESGADSIEQTKRIVAEHLIRWNWEDPKSATGNPAPCTIEGVGTVDIDVLMAIVDKWTAGVQVPDDVAKKSGSGQRFQVELPTTVPSLSDLESLSRQSST
jgi:hypothetical protein